MRYILCTYFDSGFCACCDALPCQPHIKNVRGHNMTYAPTWGSGFVMDGEDTSTCFYVSVYEYVAPPSVTSLPPSSKAICIACYDSSNLSPASSRYYCRRPPPIKPHLHSACIVVQYYNIGHHIQQNETQRGFPLPHGDRFVGLGLSTLPGTLLYYECQYEPSNTKVCIVMPCR
jgi:hypothetical protein